MTCFAVLVEAVKEKNNQEVHLSDELCKRKHNELAQKFKEYFPEIEIKDIFFAGIVIKIDKAVLAKLSEGLSSGEIILPEFKMNIII